MQIYFYNFTARGLMHTYSAQGAPLIIEIINNIIINNNLTQITAF